VYTGQERPDSVRLRLLTFTDQEFAERDVARPDELRGLLATPGVHWLNVLGVHDTRLLEALGTALGLHPLTVEDLASLGQRPKVEEYEDYLFMVARMLRPPASGEALRSEQFSLVLREGLLVTFQESDGDPFGPLRERLRQGRSRVRGMGADYLAYALIDLVVDQYFAVLEGYGDELEAMEEEVLEGPARYQVQRVDRLKRNLLVVRRAVWPLRDALASLLRTEPAYFTRAVKDYLRDAHDHAVQVVDAVETQRELVTGIHDLYLTTLNVRMNDVMKVLTIIATIFIPLTFLAGIYGMNFEHMPEYHWRWAYPALWLLMLGIATGMIVYFRRRGWL